MNGLSLQFDHVPCTLGNFRLLMRMDKGMNGFVGGGGGDPHGGGGGAEQNPSSRNMKLAGHVGFDSLPDQLVNKSLQEC